MDTVAGLAATGLAHELFRLGGTVRLDGRLSWAPADAKGFEPINAYLLRDGPTALLIDAGVAVHRQQIIDQLRTLLDPGTRLSVLLTRFEPDCLINLGAIKDTFRVERVYGGGVSNPFDFFDDVSTDAQVRHSYEVEILRQRPGDCIPVGSSRKVKLLATSLRLLTTFWAYDGDSKTLFTSDAFGYLPSGDPDERPVVNTGRAAVDVERMKEHLLAKLGWLVGADTRPLQRDLAALFGEHDIEMLCPSHGSILEGRDTVQRHLEAMQAILRDVDGGE